jgi:hypothetical protein
MTWEQLRQISLQGCRAWAASAWDGRPRFRSHTALIQRAFQDVSLKEVNTLTWCSKKIGKRAESLAERKGRPQLG